MRVNIEKVLDLKRQLKEINSVDLDQIIWLRNGSSIIFSKDLKEDFNFTGLSNTDFVEFIYVDKGADRADYQIVKEIEAGDILITQDYGLASLVLPKKARVFHHSGKEYLLETIDYLLNQRYLGAQMRKAGKRTKGPKAFTNEDRTHFYEIIHRIVEETL